MNKGAGQKIAIQFSEELVGDVSAKIIRGFIKPSGIISASNRVGGYPEANAFDGNLNTFWYNYWAGNSQWIQIRLPSPTPITGFRWMNVAGYRPKGFKVQGSSNGSTWVDIHIAESPNADGWQVIEFVESHTYEYFRWTITSYYNNYIQLLELELQVMVGNEKAIKVTGQQYKYINGPLLDMEYKIETVERHPTEAKTLLLTTFTQTRFPTVEGSLKVEYDAAVGTLAGRGGPVESFVRTFTPTDLAPEHNPGIIETITVAPAELEVNFIPIAYHKRYTEDSLTVAPAELEVNLIYVGVVNP